MKRTPAPWVGCAYGVALFVACGVAWTSPLQARAQLLPLPSLSPLPLSAAADTTPPTVTVTSPSAGTTLAGTITVTASASDNVGIAGVQFKLDGVNLGAEERVTPYAVFWDTTSVGNGPHTLTAVARDAAGNTRTSAWVQVTVSNAPPRDTTPPTVTLTSPPPGATVAGTITVVAEASDSVGIAGVQFKLDGVNLGAEEQVTPYAVFWDTTSAGNGPHTLTAVARDAAGNTRMSSPVTVTVSNVPPRDTTPPTVTITDPSGGATLAGTITVAASASDNVGIAGVQFKLDGVDLGAEEQVTPYAVFWDTTTASNGSHTLTAVARDAAGNTRMSSPLTVTVSNAPPPDTTPPTVTMTAPSGGATVSGIITVAASATDNRGVIGVQFKLDGANLGAEDLTDPFSTAWNTASVSNGSHTLTAVARDAAGNTRMSSPVTVTVSNAPPPDTTPPTVTMTAPSGGATVSGIITVAASATDNAGVIGVQFKLDGANLGAEDLTDPFSTAWNTASVSNGSHTLTAVARDAAGNIRTSAGVTVTVSNGGPPPDTTPPTVEVTSPSSGAPVAGIATVSAGASDNVGVAGVRFFVDGVAIGGEDTTVPYSVAWDTTTASNGSHTLTAVARDAAGNTRTSAPVTVTVSNAPRPDTTPPTVSVTAPSAGATPSGIITVSASATDNVGVAGVQFRLDGVSLGAEDTAAPYAVAWDTTTTSNGTHTLTAVARDAAGNRTTSASVTITVSNAAPTATRFENTDLSITYTPGAPPLPPFWFHGSRSRAWSGGTSSVNRAEGGRATFTFTGTSVTWIGFRAPWAGIARVFVDGVFRAEVDLFNPPTTGDPDLDEDVQAPVFTARGLAPGRHTLTVEATGRRNPAASPDCTPTTCGAVFVDAFDVSPATAPPTDGTRVEQAAPAIAYTAGWTQGDTARAWSGGTAAISATAGARATFTFTGTTVSWIGIRGPHTGVARVFLDGAFHAEVDTFYPAEVQTAIFTVPDLAPGSHTLAIEATGLQNPAATAAFVVVDAFDVRSRFEDRDASIAYTGEWTQRHIDKAWSGTSISGGSGTAALTGRAGARATFTFAGTSVSWIGMRGPESGIARVSLDGAFQAEVDTFAPTEELRTVNFAATGLAPRSHTLTVEVTGLKNAAATEAFVAVDAFDVALLSPVPRVSRVQETDPSIAYTSGWTPEDVSAFSSGGTATSSATAGAQATFTFTGTAVRWLGRRGPEAGIARVFLDGALVAEVDTFLTFEEVQVVLARIDGLAAGSHRLTIEVTGRKNAAARGAQIVVDAFEVTR
jgi:hypothetical protein